MVIEVARVVMISIILNIRKKCSNTQIPSVINHFAFALKNNHGLCKIFLELIKNGALPINSISVLILLALTDTEVGDNGDCDCDCK